MATAGPGQLSWACRAHTAGLKTTVWILAWESESEDLAQPWVFYACVDIPCTFWIHRVRQAVSSTGHPIDIAHSSLELLSDPPTAASQVAGITGTRHHTGPVVLPLKRKDSDCQPTYALKALPAGAMAPAGAFMGAGDGRPGQRGEKPQPR
uniref:Uncharacterized protein n=1 Tax=Chelydra serpentina TaxID=8475 RepID=A0A8C3SF68_CHESE